MERKKIQKYLLKEYINKFMKWTRQEYSKKRKIDYYILIIKRWQNKF